MVAVIWLVLDGTGKIVLLNNFLQAMLSGVAAFFQTQTSHRFRARLTMSATFLYSITHYGPVLVFAPLFGKISTHWISQKIKQLKHFTDHRMDPLIQLRSSLNLKVDGIKPTCLIGYAFWSPLFVYLGTSHSTRSSATLK